MRSRRLLGWLAFALCAAVPGLIYLLVQAATESTSRSPAQELTDLSRKGLSATYGVRYGAVGMPAPTSDALVVYRALPAGVRFEFSEPITLNDDDDDTEEVLKGGDILIINRDHPAQFISCRSARRSCRSADGFESLVFASIGSIFIYPEGALFDQSHTVRRVDDVTILHETARCYVVDMRLPTAGETPNAGIDPDDSLPVTLCYATDGVPLRFIGGAIKSEDGDATIEALEIDRSVDRSVFDPPYPFVASIYDRDED